MNHSVLTKYLILINNQLIFQEKLLGHLVAADSMFQILLGSNLSNHSSTTIYHYLSELSDIVHEAKDQNEILVDNLMEIISLKELSHCSCNSTIVH